MALSNSAWMNAQEADSKARMLKVVSGLLPQQMDNWCTHFPPIPNPSTAGGKKVILSGCTGFLGRNILAQLLQRPKIPEIVLLVHNSEGDDAHRALESQRRVQEIVNSCGVLHHVKLRVFGVSTTERWTKDAYQDLADGLTEIIHAAWPTERFQDTGALIPHLRGLLELYNIAALAKQHNPSSKWIAEQLLYRLSSGSRPHPQPEVRIVRIGLLTAATTNPSWKLNEKWPLMFTNLEKIYGKWPNLDALGYGRLDWLPVNFAAKAVLDIAFADGTGEGIVEGVGVSVAHVLNCYANGKRWKEVQEWLVKPGFVGALGGSSTVKIIPGDRWLRELLKKGRERGWNAGEDDERYVPRNYFELYRREFKEGSERKEARQDLAFETRRTESLSFIMKNGKHQADMTEERLKNINEWIFEETRRFEGVTEPEEASTAQAVEFRSF